MGGDSRFMTMEIDPDARTKMRGELLTKVQYLAVTVEDCRKGFLQHFPMDGDDPTYMARSLPGGIFQTMQQDIQRLRARVSEASGAGVASLPQKSPPPRG